MAAPSRPVRLWDPVVRLTHWTIAIVVLLNAVVTQGGGTFHVTLGWIGMTFLALRLVWGLVGAREARFSAFPPRPFRALAHLRELLRGTPRDYPSHNPAGAMMAYALWALLALVIATGLYVTGGATPMQVAADRQAVAEGDWSALVKRSESGEDGDRALKDAAEEVHVVAANLILILVVLHLGGVAAETRALRRSLIAPMLRGDRGRPRG